ncbi:hypothetical protein PspLS_05210, partial [Pyricularia sp. CBS 133598]
MKPTAHSESISAQPGSPTPTCFIRLDTHQQCHAAISIWQVSWPLGHRSHIMIKPCVVDNGIPPLTSLPRPSRQVSMFNIKAAMDALFSLVFLGSQELPA